MILTLYSLYQYDTALFDSMALPDSVNREKCVDNIVLECGVFGVAYQNLDFLKTAVEAWSATRSEAWGKIADALEVEYSPIENYDRMEESEDSGNVNGNANSQNYNTSFESDNFKATQKNDTNSDTTSRASHKSHIHGNIGVTTSQQMINEELKLRETDIYKIIANEFKNKFCIAVYY